jgi:hypothetical protein
MAQAGFTPISLYFSSTAAAVPSSGNLVNGELALNTADMKLYAKNSAGTVTLLASNAGASGSVTSVSGTGTVNGLTLTGTVTTSGSLTLGGTLSLVSPPPIGSTTPNTGAFTTLSATSTLGVTGATTLSSTLRVVDSVTIRDDTLNTPRILTFSANATSAGNLGTIRFGNTQNLNNNASIVGAIDVNIDDARLSFSTTPTGGSITERFRFGSLGQFGIGGATYGLAGQVLTSGGASAPPTWASAGGGSGFTAKTANYTAASGDNILANTSAGSWTLTLPASPSTGNAVQVMDSIGTFGQYPLTVARNGSTIMSAAEDMTMAVNGAATTFVYNGSTWRVI